MSTPATLKRSLSLPLITFYGLGTILGAGIYVLIGEVVGHAGMYAPLSFLIAALLAAFTACSYAELSARFPLSGGESIYVQRAFGRKSISRLVGLSMVAIGLVSTATLLNGFVGYLRVFVDLPGWLIIVTLVFVLGGLAIWGITQSAWAAMLTSWIELGGLFLIIYVGGESLAALPERLPEMVPTFSAVLWPGIFAGAFVAFYAYIGFEDMINVAEEVKNPSRNMPAAVLLALIVSTLLYLVIAVITVLTVPPADMAGHDAPLALVYERSTGKEPFFISLIGMSAVINGALIQIIMASRVLYGMANQGWLPDLLAQVHPSTRTPLKATAVSILAILILALWLPLLTLAQITSLISLLVFTMVNLSLWRVKQTMPQPANTPNFPRWLPVLGFFASLLFVLFQIWQWISG